jgi:hypothetical protein
VTEAASKESLDTLSHNYFEELARADADGKPATIAAGAFGSDRDLSSS